MDRRVRLKGAKLRSDSEIDGYIRSREEAGQHSLAGKADAANTGGCGGDAQSPSDGGSPKPPNGLGATPAVAAKPNATLPYDSTIHVDKSTN